LESISKRFAAKGITDVVLDAIKDTTHLFLNSSFENYAYQDKAFPIMLVKLFHNPIL
jgi:protein-L-isoaspartate O-methyltransferase